MSGPCSTRCTTPPKPSCCAWPGRRVPWPLGAWRCWSTRPVAAHEIWYGTRFRPEDIAALCQDAGAELARLFREMGEEAAMEHQEPAKKKRRRPRRRPRVQKPRPPFGEHCAVRLYGLRQKQRGAAGGQAVGAPVLRFGQLHRAAGRHDGGGDFRQRGGRRASAPGRPKPRRRWPPKRAWSSPAGGGTVLSPRNVEAFHKHGAPHPVFRRARGGPPGAAENDKRRPLLQVPDRRKVIAELYEKRVPLYRAAAGHHRGRRRPCRSGGQAGGGPVPVRLLYRFLVVKQKRLDKRPALE